MKISDVMTPHVEVIMPDATIVEAAKKMKDLDVGVLPVCDGDRLRGTITDRDIVVRGIVDGKDVNSMKVSDCMTNKVVYCFDDDDTSKAADLMKSHQVRRCMIVNRNKRLVGIVSIGDLAVDEGDTRKVGETVQSVSQPTKTAA